MTNQPGLTLADLAAMSEAVPVGTNTITVHGISTANALAIFRRFPALFKLMNGFDIKTFIEVAPDAVAAVIAAGTGNFDDPEAEAQAAAIGIEIQFDLLEAIGRLTFKSGFGPFMDRIMALAGHGPVSGLSGKAPAMKSPPASKPALQPDIPQT